MPAESIVPKVIKDGIITLYDATGTTRLEYEVVCEPGSFTIDPGESEFTDVYDREEICASREGQKPIGTLSFAAHLRDFTNDTAGNLLDFIDATGGYAARLPTGDGRFEGKVLGVQYDALSATTANPPDDATYSTRVDSPITRLRWDMAEGDPDTINVNGTILGDVIRTEEDTP